MNRASFRYNVVPKFEFQAPLWLLFQSPSTGYSRRAA